MQGETKLIFLVYRKDNEKNQRQLVGKIKIILFDSLGSVFFKKYYFA